MSTNHTVSVERIEGYNALRMTWQRQVTETDVRDAFRKITDALENADEPTYMVVDLLSNPEFPMRVTVVEALPAYRHPMLRQWLIVGSNRLAHMVETVLSGATRRKNVLWVSSEEEAVNHTSQAHG